MCRSSRRICRILLERGPRTVVIAGADAGPDAELLAHEGSWPLIAEIVSGARFGRHLVHGYRELLVDPDLGGRIERAIVLGHPTLSREVAALLADPDVAVFAVRGPGEPLNLNGSTVPLDALAVAPGEGDREWLGDWLRASRAASVDLSPPAPDADGLASAVPGRAPRRHRRRTRRHPGAPRPRRARRRRLARDLAARSARVRIVPPGAGGRCACSAARRCPCTPTAASPASTAPSRRRWASRWPARAAGGQGSPASCSATSPSCTTSARCCSPPAEREPRLQVIVGNDGGGTIFDGLEVAGVAGRDAMDRVLYTPHTVRLEQLALAYGWEYQRVTTRSALDQALTSPVGGRQLIEVPLPR